MPAPLKVHEIFHSLQGESILAGFPCVFIRLAGCALRCSYCDTKKAWEQGEDMPLETVVEKALAFNADLAEITGGEPMQQPGAVDLAVALLGQGFSVMMETNGTIDLSPLPPEVIRIVDIKTPGSGAGGSFLYSNLHAMQPHDEIKFVVTSREDFDWAVEQTREHGLLRFTAVNMSAAEGTVRPQELAGWVLETGLPLRLNLQLHKFLDLP